MSQVFDFQAVALLPQLAPHPGATMRTEAIAQQNRVVISKMPLEGAQVMNDPRLLNRTGMEAQRQSYAPVR
jgi:hypothetical protein